MGGIHPPQSEWTDASTFDQLLPLELLEGEVNGPGRAVDPADKLAGMEFLPRGACQERQ